MLNRLSLQLLAQALVQDCVGTWGAGTIEANTLCSADYVNLVPTTADDNYLDALPLTEVKSSVGGSSVAQSKGDEEMFYIDVIEPRTSNNSEYQIPAYVIGESVFF